VTGLACPPRDPADDGLVPAVATGVFGDAACLIAAAADRMDAGAIAAQEWVFVKKGETARELWERALAPLGQKLLGEVIDYAKIHKSLPAKPQDEQFATKAPSLGH